MPFSYYARLTRAQQAVYRRSDAITEIRLPQAERFASAVDAVESALLAEDRAATQAASERVIGGLMEVLGAPPVRVEVLAARPHAGWGELHGLYTAERGKRPKIQLWMRTAKQKRVVAFRTYLRTLLHEVGHHLDYTVLRLEESYHTEGFYKRESSLFHQLVTDLRRSAMPTMEEYAKQPREQRMKRLERTADELAAAIRGQTDAALSRRPDSRNWAAKEVVCHLRDLEETFMLRFETIMASDNPRLSGPDPDRWADERQYLRNDAGEALAAFRRRRSDTLAFLGKLAPGDWERAGTHPVRGKVTIDNFLTLIAWHDDNHLDQLRRALEGKA
jgi:DinB family protein